MTYCAHCGKSIQYHEIFGWYHGDMNGGWNTSCEGDETRADPGEKLIIDRWQHDELIDVLSCGGRDNFDGVWNHMRKTYEIRKLEQCGTDVKNVYIFYGYKQDATIWGLMNDVSRKNILCASEWARMQGRRARPVIIGQDSEWSKLNWNHEFSRQTRQQVTVLEAYYGSADG